MTPVPRLDYSKPPPGYRLLSAGGPYCKHHAAHLIWQAPAVDVTAEVLPPNRVPQVHCRGRWRAVKRKLRALAAELGWPGCMEVASVYQVEGRVLMAGAKLAVWHKFTSKHRRKPADRTTQRRHRKALRANLRDPDYVPF